VSNGWYYNDENRTFGPLSEEELKTLATSGKLKPTDKVRREGMTNWLPAGRVKGLFANATPPPSASEASTVTRLHQGVNRVADTTATLTEETLGKEGSEGAKPAIFLHSQSIGGRTRIGRSLEPLHTLGGNVAAAIFSWSYLISVLLGTVSSWQFVPLKHTEYVRITLRQSLRWNLLMPSMAVWVICVIATITGALIMANATPWTGAFTFVVGYLGSNLIACQMIAGFDVEELHRTELVLYYGFPRKYQLLFGISDAPVELQLEGVLDLCEAIGGAEFSRWEQFTSHDTRRGMFARLLGSIPGVRRFAEE
jgi:hypothetical protein